MLFGLFNAPASFQGYVNKILAENLDVFFIYYNEYTVIYTEVSTRHSGVHWIRQLLLAFHPGL